MAMKQALDRRRAVIQATEVRDALVLAATHLVMLPGVWTAEPC